MEIVLQLVTVTVALLGWFKTEKWPTKLNVLGALVVVVLATMQFLLDRSEQAEERALRAQIAELHERLLARPAFSVAVNDTIITADGQEVRIPAEEGSRRFTITLHNTGRASAQAVQAYLLVPEGSDIRELGRYWRHHGMLEEQVDGGFAKVQGVTQYVFIAPAPIHPKNWMKLGSGNLGLSPSSIPMRLKVSAGDVNAKWDFTVTSH